MAETLRKRRNYGEESAITTSYAPTEAEQAAMDRQRQRKKARPPAPSFSIEQRDGATALVFEHHDPKVGLDTFNEALGTCDSDFARGLLSQIGNAVSKGPALDKDALDFALAAVRGIQPRDEAEAMLASQMAAIHTLTMTFARRLIHVENIEQQNSAANALNKLARTFTAQLTALKNYRTGGEQRVTVQHVNVNQGGQAIVGEVHHGSQGEGASSKRKG